MADATGDVVHHGKGVIARNRSAPERTTSVEVSPRIDRDHQTRTHDREPDQDVASVEERLDHILIHQRTHLGSGSQERILGLLGHHEGLGQCHAHEREHDQQTPGKPRRGHDEPAPVHQVTHGVGMLGLVETLPDRPGIEPGDREVQNPDEEEHVLSSGSNLFRATRQVILFFPFCQPIRYNQAVCKQIKPYF